MYKILFATATAWVFTQGGAVSAQTFPNLTPNPAPFVTFANPGSSAPVDPPNDFLVVNTIQPALGSTALTTTGLLPLSAFASSTDLKATNALVASALTSVNSLSTSVTGLSAGLAALSSQVGTLQQFAIDARLEARRGVASAMAISSASMPSAPGHTSWVLNAAEFHGETAVGGSIAHRFDTSFPFALTAGVAVSTSHAADTGARIGLAGEF